jgi:hypothetical protein
MEKFRFFQFFGKNPIVWENIRFCAPNKSDFFGKKWIFSQKSEKMEIFLSNNPQYLLPRLVKKSNFSKKSVFTLHDGFLFKCLRNQIQFSKNFIATNVKKNSSKKGSNLFFFSSELEFPTLLLLLSFSFNLYRNSTSFASVNKCIRFFFSGTL